MKYYIEVVDSDDDAVVKLLGPYHSLRQAEKADDGLNRQMDQVKYYSRIKPETNMSVQKE